MILEMLLRCFKRIKEWTRKNKAKEKIGVHKVMMDQVKVAMTKRKRKNQRKKGKEEMIPGDLQLIFFYKFFKKFFQK